MDTQHEPTSDATVARCEAEASVRSPKGAGDDEDVDGCGDDLEEEEDARLRGVLGTVSEGASQGPSGKRDALGGPAAGRELEPATGPVAPVDVRPGESAPPPQHGARSPETANDSVRPDVLSKRSAAHLHMPRGHLHWPPQHSSLMTGVCCIGAFCMSFHIP